MTYEQGTDKPLGNLIRRRRKALGLTQDQLAEQVGVSQVTISDWERNGTIPHELGNLAAVLSINDDELAATLTSQVAGDDDVVQAIRRQTRLRPDVRNALITIYEQVMKTAP